MISSEAATILPYSALSIFCKKVFEQVGFTESDAETSARLLTRADLRGVDSHGVARLSGYLRLIDAGRLNPRPNFSWHSRFPTLHLLDADQSIGFTAAKAAMEKGIAQAQELGVAMVAVKNSNHFGIAGQYALMAAEKGLIGMAFTNASPLVAPTHGNARLLGTNPISIAIPAARSKPFLLDMATTTAANGKLEILQRKNLDAPKGWVQDASGQDSANPHALKDGGALKPLGSYPEMGSHKGYGLAAAVDILSGVLTGANFGPWVPPFVSFLPLLQPLVGEGIGHFFIVFRPDGFLEQAQFLERMEKWMETFRNSEGVNGAQVQVAGDPEWKMEEIRLSQGVPLLPAVWADLQHLASRFGLDSYLLS